MKELSPCSQSIWNKRHFLTEMNEERRGGEGAELTTTAAMMFSS
jgi:hypothetical protein